MHQKYNHSRQRDLPVKPIKSVKRKNKDLAWDLQCEQLTARKWKKNRYQLDIFYGGSFEYRY